MKALSLDDKLGVAIGERTWESCWCCPATGEGWWRILPDILHSVDDRGNAEEQTI